MRPVQMNFGIERKINRLKRWDYSSNGYYFLTICSDEKRKIFGEISGKELVKNDLGRVAEMCWVEIPRHFENIGLDEWVIMPNHIHGIIRVHGGDAYMHPVRNNRSKMLISKAIQNFKAAVSRKSGMKRIWQRSFFDRIIRDEKGLEKIREYIRTNPKMWGRHRNNLGK